MISALPLHRLQFVFDNNAAIWMAKRAGVYDTMLKKKEESGLECGDVVQRMESPLCVTDFTYWFGRTHPEDNGWSVVFGLVSDFGSISLCKAALNEIAQKARGLESN